MTSRSSIYKLKRSDNEVPGLNKGAPAYTWCSYNTIDILTTSRQHRDIKMHMVELTVSSYIAKKISRCALMLMFYQSVLLQYKGQPFVEYKGKSKATACCMYALGYCLLLLLGMAAGGVALCRATKVNFAMLL